MSADRPTVRFQIDDASPEDWAMVKSLVLAGLAARWGNVDPTRNADLDDMAAAHPHSRTVVARTEAGTVVGTGTIVPVGDGRADVIRMSVSDEYRGLGIGRRVLSELVATARRWECVRVVLETTSTWTDAVAFYQRCGFVITHQVHDVAEPQTWLALSLRNRPEHL